MASQHDVEKFPYKTYLNILHGPLELIDVQKLADACTDKWYNQTLCKVNDAVLRMAVVQGEYHWHEHKDIDEFFFVLEGRSLIADGAQLTLIACRNNVRALDHQNHRSFRRACTMAHAFRHDEALSRRKIDYAIFEIDQEMSVEDEKEFIDVFVFVPVIFTLNDRHPDD
jgi:hypothetical protein